MNSVIRGTTLARLLFVFTILTLTTAMQAQVWTRATSLGGNGTDSIVAVKVNSSNSVFLTGYFSNTITLGSKTLTAPSGAVDMFITKLDGWAVGIGGGESSTTLPNDLALDSAGNLYVTGWFTTSATFGTNGGHSITVSGAGETIFLAKYNSSGAVQWVQTGQQSGGGLNNGDGIAVDSVHGKVYVVGVSQGSTTFSSASGGTHVVAGPETWHMVLAQYDTNGNFQWGTYNAASPNTVPEKVAVDSSGNVYIAGWFEGQITFYSVSGGSQTVVGLSGPVQTPPDYPNDGFVVQYNSSGSVQWIDDIGGYKAMMFGITVTAGGEIAVTGLIGNLNGNTQQKETLVLSQPPENTINLGSGEFTNPYNRDIIVATYNSAGEALTAVRAGGTTNEDGADIVASGSNLYVSGLLENTSNAFVAQFSGGLLDWIVTNGGPIVATGQTGPALAITPSGGLYVVGAFAGTARFGKTTLTTAAGATDGFYAQFTP